MKLSISILIALFTSISAFAQFQNGSGDGFAFKKLSEGSGMPLLTITTPNGGETLTAGNTQTITWTTTGATISNVKLEYSTNAGVSYSVITNSVSNTGSYSWTVPNKLTNTALIRIKNAANASMSGISAGYFSIAQPSPPTLHITYPNNANETIYAGSTVQIQWTSSGTPFPQVKLEYSTDGGSTFDNVITNSVSNSGSYSWTVPETLTSTAKIRISNANNSNISDVSDENFAIAQEQVTPVEVLLVSPQELYNSSFNDAVKVGDLISKIEMRRVGIAADGVSKLLIAVPSNLPVKFKLSSYSDGSLGSLQDPDKHLTEIPIGGAVNNFRVAVYTAPDVIGGEGKERTITINYQIGSQPWQSKIFHLVPPPVVFVHGIWSGPGSWTDFANKISDETGIHHELADYSHSSACTINPYDFGNHGITAIQSSIENAFNFMKLKLYECLNVDVVGHSAGGLMAYGFCQLNNNLVHRLISVGTPFLGSPFAKFLYDNRWKLTSTQGESWIPYVPIWNAADAKKHEIGPMIEDLIPNSNSLNKFNIVNVKNHRIGAHWTGGNGVPSSKTEIDRFIQIIDPTQTVEKIMGNAENDVIVSLNSQLSGASPSSCQFVDNVPGVVHYSNDKNDKTETSSSDIYDKIKFLLKTDNSYFANTIPKPDFSNPIIRQKKDDGSLLANIPKNRNTIQSTTESISITSPSTGANFILSTTTQITISFSTSAGTKLSTTGLCYIDGVGAFDIPQNPPYSITFNLNEKCSLGQSYIYVLCRTTTETVISTSSYIYINTTQAAIKIEATPDKISLSPSSPSRNLFVQGYFGSSVSTANIQNLTDGTSGSSFATLSGGTIASVSQMGLVTIAGIGVDSVIISFGSISTTVSVSIVPDLLSPTVGTIFEATTAVLQWDSMQGASSYTAQLSENSDFSQNVVTFANLTVTSQTVSISSSKLYYWRVKAFSTTSSTDWSDAWIFHTYLLPSALTATATNAQVSLVWTTSSSVNVSGYKIFRGVTSGIYSFLATTTATTYTDFSVSNCTTYFYCVRTFTGSQESPNSLEASAMPSLQRSISVATPSNTAPQTLITLGWTSVGCIDSVSVSYSTDNGDSWNFIETIANSGSYLWTVPNSPTTTALVKVTSNVNPEIVSTSSTFTITHLYTNAPIKVFLEGAFIATTGTMQTLRDFMPLIDPYTNSVTVATIPANVTDWLRVEFRSNSDFTQVITSAVCFVRNDGLVLDLDSAECVRMLSENFPTGNYYIVVQHRNHLKIMSAQPVTLTYDSPLYDFTSSQNQAYPADGSSVKQIATGVYGMIAGDASANGYINAVDRAQIRNSAGTIGYSQQDASLDGIVNGVDRVISINNMFRIMQVP